MGAEKKRPAAENITTAISRFHDIHSLRASEAARGSQVLASGESGKPHGGLKLPLVGLDPHHGGLDFRLFQSDERHFRADQPRFQSAVSDGRLKNLRVRLNQRRGGLEMTAVESDAWEVQSAAQVVRLDERHFQSAMSDLQSGGSHFQSDEPLVGPKQPHGRLADRHLRLNQRKVGAAVLQVEMKMMLFRPNHSHGGLKVWGVESDVSEIQSAMWIFQSRMSQSRLSKSFLRF